MKKILAILAILIHSSIANSQSPIEKIVDGFDQFLTKYPQEKLYLHIDRTEYSSGETIWIKVYLLAGMLQQPSPLSENIYIELYNEQGTLLKNTNIKSQDGIGNGYFDLPDSISNGKYAIRAYTNWMKNGSAEYFFHKNINIWTNHNQEILSNILENNIDVQFFPEGGDLVNGLVSKVAFKATDKNGLGVQIRGTITDTNYKIITEFKSNDLGMGIFHIQPDDNMQYFAKIENYDYKYILPEILSDGIVMTTRNYTDSDVINIKIQSPNGSAYKNVFVIAHTRGIVGYTARVNLKNEIAVVNIPKSNLLTGVSQITIADSTGNPLAERLIFMEDTEEPISIEISSGKKYYSTREEVTLDISVKDINNNPIKSNLSISVVDEAQIRFDNNQEDILSWLYLTSELKGYIESPGYYFNIDNEDREMALDYLLLTQGWRRYTIRRALEESQFNPIYEVEKGFTIRGRMVREYSNKTIPDGKVTFIDFNDPNTLKEATTNEYGEFVLEHLLLFDSSEVALQGKNKKGSLGVRLLIDTTINSPSLTYPIRNNYESLSEFEQNFLKKSIERRKIEKAYRIEEGTILLDEMSVKGQRILRNQTTASFYGPSTTTLSFADDLSVKSVNHPLLLLMGRVAGVQISRIGQNTGEGSEWYIRIQGVNSITLDASPLILVDDMPYGIDGLHLINAQDIELIKVWKGAEAAMFGSRGTNGVIGFYTKKGGSSPSDQPGLVRIKHTGYQVSKEFYSPKYDIKKPEHVKPDHRVTLFWAPEIETNSEGKGTVSFYNHDIETSVIGIIQGITDQGKPVVGKFRYEIKN